MEDHHVDRWHVEAWQHVKLSHTNRSIGLIIPPKPPCSGKPQTKGPPNKRGKPKQRGQRPKTRNPGSYPETSKQRRKTPKQQTKNTNTRPNPIGLGRPGGHGEGPNTRSHPELGRENPQRQWYCVSRRGRVGRRQVFQARNQNTRTLKTTQNKNPKPQTRGGAAR